MPDIAKWWKAEDTDAAKEVYAFVCQLIEAQKSRLEMNIRCARLYGNINIVGMTPGDVARTTQRPLLPQDRQKYNIIASMCDTVAAKISKSDPRVTFLTERGNIKSQTGAKLLQEFMLGAFYDTDAYDLGKMAFKDSTIFDVGVTKNYILDKKIVSERVLPNELLVDEVDAMYGKPTHMYQIKYIHKDVLKARFPKAPVSAIEMGASEFKMAFAGTGYSNESDIVAVIEAWHLPSGKGAKDGKHIICTSSGLLVNESYTRKWFPFVVQRWSKRVIGFYGQSLAERLISNQIEINRMLKTIQTSFKLGASFKVFVEHNSRVALDHLNDEIGTIVQYAGTPPTFKVPQTVHREFFEHLKWLIQASYEEAGISQLSATSKKPRGLDAAVAMREYQDIESERFVLIGQEYERYYLEMARQYFHLAKEIGSGYSVKGESKNFIKSIHWEDIDLDENEFKMKMFPVSMLPVRPEGRLQMVNDLKDMGYIDQDYAMELLDFPDLRAFTELKNAPLELMKSMLDKIMSQEEFFPPEPYHNLELGKRLFQDAYAKAELDGVDESVLEALRRWLNQCQALLDKANPAPALAPPGAAVGVPPVAGLPPEAGIPPIGPLPPQ